MTNKVEVKLALEGKAEVVGGIREVGQQMRESGQTMAQAVAAADVKVKDLGMSVKQLNAATRGIGPQFTDIFTGLASGQAPMTVLIQQGGQLKDMFGGVLPAAKALGGYVAGLINPFTVAAGAAAALAYAAYQGSKETDAYTRSIVMTGNATGVTAGQLSDMARRISEVRGTQASAAEALAEMVGTGRVAREDLQKFSQVAVDMERTVGQSVAETAKSFADLAKDPVKASLKLNEALGYLTAATYAQIKAAKEMGDDERAASLAQNALADALATRAAQMQGSLGTVERAWRAVKSVATGAWDAMLGIGRQASIADRLGEVSAQIAKIEEANKGGLKRPLVDAQLEGLKVQQAYLQEQIRLEQRGAEAASARAAANRAGVEAIDKVTAANTKAMTKQEQMNKALADYRQAIADIRVADPNSALLDPKKIAAAEEGIRRQYKETKAARTAAEIELEKEAALMAKLSGVNADYQEQLTRLQAIRDKTNMSEERYVELVKQLIAEQPGVKKQMEEEAKALKDLVEARNQARTKEAAGIAAFMEAQTEAEHKSLQSVADRVQGLQDEAAALAISQDKNISLAAAVEMVAIARLKEEQARKFVPGYEGWEAIQREIDKRQELLGLMNTKDLREREQSGWLAFYTSLDNTAHQTFTNVLEGGQGIWTKLRNTAKSVFFDWLYQMTAKKWLFNLTVSVSGGALPASAGAGGLSDVGSLKNLTSMAGMGGGFSAGIGAGFSSLMGEAGIMGGLDAGMIALQAGNIAGGLGTLAGVLGPIALGIGAVYTLAKKLDHSGTPHTGGGSAYSAASGLSSTPTGRWTGGTTWGDGFGSVMGSETTNAMTAQLAQSVVGMLDATATSFGKSAGYSMATSFADDASSDPAWGSLVIKQLDSVLVNWNDARTSKWAPRQFSDGSAGSAEYLAAVSADVRKALDGIGLPAWATQMLDKLGDAPALDQLANTVALITRTQAVFGQLGQAMSGFAAISDDGRARLVAASGGIDALATAAGAYYDAMYTEDEKRATTVRQYTSALQAVNQAIPTSIEGYRQQVSYLESIAGTEPAAAAALAVMYQVGPAFASVNQPVAALASTVVDTAEEVATLDQELDALRSPIRSIKDIAQGIFRLEQEGASLQVELLKTYGDETSLREAARLTRAAETAGMTEQELRLYDLNAARRAEITAINAQRQAIADGVASWEAYFDLFGSAEEKQSRAKARVQAVLPADVDTLQEYKDYVWRLTEVYGVGSAEVKKATDVARDFAAAFPAVSETIAAASTALTTDLTAYYAALFTPAEQVGYATGVMAQQFAGLGLSMPTTVQGFKDLVAGLDTSTEAGRVAYNTVVGLAGAWKDLQPAVAAAVTATTDLSAYHAAYFTEAERAGLATTSLTATLASVGLALPTTRDGFRALVQAQDLSTESGIRTYNTLIGVAGAFADLVPAATVGAAAVEALDDLLTRLRNPVRTLEQIAGNIVSLEEELFQAQNAGNTQALRDHLLAGLTPDEQKIKKAIWAIEDYNQSVADTAAANQTAADEMQRAAEAAAAAAQKIASEHDGLWRQWLQANGDTAALRALDLAALDPANRALQEQVWALQDQKAAAEEASRAAETMASDMQRAAETAAAAAQKIASEHDGLWRQWLQASGDTAALRALDLAALDPANRALQQQIWALEDQKKAAEEATAAAEQMKSAWSSLTDSMLDEVRRIRGLIDEGSGAGYASLAAQFATATAQTRAGDQAAAKLLPGLSQSMLTAFESTATSLVDLQRVRALTANSLETTASLASGTTPAGYGMATAAPVYTAAPAASATQATTAQTTELQGLRAEVAALRTALEAVVVNTGKSRRLHEEWNTVGLPVTNPVDGTPLSVV